MKINILKSVILFVIMIIAFNANAQNDDRIITINNDTIPCKISGPNLFGAYKYSKNGDSQTPRIKVDDVKEFYSAGKLLWHRRVFFGNNREIFMRVLVRGKISIYETFVTVNGYTSQVWYSSKSSDTAIFLQTNRVALFTGNDKGRKLFAGFLEDKKVIYDDYVAIKSPDIEDMMHMAKLYDVGEPLKPQ
jgi:hypothetical protein